MKVEQVNEVKFSPIEIKITIESRRELEYFWSLFNESSGVRAENANNSKEENWRDFTSKDVPETISIWEILDSHV